MRKRPITFLARVLSPKRFCTTPASGTSISEEGRKKPWGTHTQHIEDDFDNLRKETRAWARRPETNHMVIALTKQVGQAGRAHDWRKAISILREIESRGLEPNVITYNAVLKVLRETHRVRDMEGLLREMKQKGIEFDSGTYCEVISSYGFEGKTTYSLKYFRECLEKNLDNPVVYGAMLKACAVNGDFKSGVLVYKQLKDSYHLVNDVHYASLFQLAARSKNPDFALNLRDEYLKSDFTSLPVWSTILNAFSLCKRPDLFWDTLKKLQETDHVPSIFTYREIIQACENFNDVESAKKFFPQIMEKFEWSLDKSQCVSMMLKVMTNTNCSFEEGHAIFSSVPMEHRSMQLYESVFLLCLIHQKWTTLDNSYEECLKNPLFQNLKIGRACRTAQKPPAIFETRKDGPTLDFHRHCFSTVIASTRNAVFVGTETLCIITGHGKTRESKQVKYGRLKKQTLEWLREYLPKLQDKHDGHLQLSYEDMKKLRLMLPWFDVQDLVTKIASPSLRR